MSFDSAFIIKSILPILWTSFDTRIFMALIAKKIYVRIVESGELLSLPSSMEKKPDVYVCNNTTRHNGNNDLKYKALSI